VLEGRGKTAISIDREHKRQAPGKKRPGAALVEHPVAVGRILVIDVHDDEVGRHEIAKRLCRRRIGPRTLVKRARVASLRFLRRPIRITERLPLAVDMRVEDMAPDAPFGTVLHEQHLVLGVRFGQRHFEERNLVATLVEDRGFAIPALRVYRFGETHVSPG
jgi:hypothetical protein